MTPTSTEQSQLIEQLTQAVKPKPPTDPAKKPVLIKPTASLAKLSNDFDPTQLYEPPNLVLSARTDNRIAIIGGPGSGKTTSCLTFPNRIWVDFDHKLPPNEKTLPFWNSQFSDSLAKRTFANVVNRRDAFKFWFRDNHHKFHENQTLIIDSWTMVMNAFEVQTCTEDDVLDQNDRSNKFWLHKQRLRYCRDIFDLMRACRCLIVVTLHESPDRDEQGELNGKIRPLMDGQFKDQLLGQFTDVWRQRSNIFETDEKRMVRRDPATKQKIPKRINHKGNPNWVWFWQLLGDQEFDTNCNSILGEKVRKHNKYLIPADFAEIQKIYQLP